MRFLILSQYFPPEMGAPQSRLLELANGLTDLGWKVDVITAMPNYPTGKIFADYKKKFSVEEKFPKFLVKRYWLFPSNSTNIFHRLLSMLSFSITVVFSIFDIRKLNPNYIFVESPPLTLAFSAWILSLFTKSKLLLNVSDLWPLSAKELGAINDGFLYRIIEAFEGFLYKRAFACIGQSQEIVDYISKRGSQNVFLFRNGVDSKRFNSIDPVNKTSNRLVYAGLLGVAQGISDICKNINFKDLEVEFHIYGSGPEEKKIKDFLSDNSDSGIYLHSPVKRDEIPEVLKNYDGTIIPLVKKIYGAVPSKIYEAMAAGLPIIFSGDGEGADIIAQHKVGWVSAAGDFCALKNNISDFANNFSKRDLCSVNGIKAASQVFERRIQISNLDKFLRSSIQE